MAKRPASVDAAFAALADPTRRRILDDLRTRPLSVGALAEPHEMALPSFLKHVRVLEAAGLVVTRKTGRVRTVTRVPDALADAESWMRSQTEFWTASLDRLATRLEEPRE